MRGLLEIGEVMLASSQRRLETVSNNIAQASTPGFKRESVFEPAVRAADAETTLQRSADFSQGALRLTGRPLDLAIAGPGFFALRNEDQIFYTRAGDFDRAADGRLVNAQGFALQSSSGNDIALGPGPFEVLADGAVLQDGLPVAHIAVLEPVEVSALSGAGGALFEAPAHVMRESGNVNLRQGMLESANVELASEMLDMMKAVRGAEIGARVVQAYDGLIGQALTTFGRMQR